ncbi:hypothetical protein PSEHALCIP103_01069 [Pseudoalteromonas haloplanktis]|uniref:Uncharacterized protein n=1 Tax=Pseudoalteromonas haloplanktis TaxID=228 RepID=A0A9W4VP09_PSEHA|nr:hypothetical protein PSEHALCIP103_01069 [Pseudoalteromonas haloplanktis]
MLLRGRDNLANKGIASVSTELNYENFIIIPWLSVVLLDSYSGDHCICRVYYFINHER